MDVHNMMRQCLHKNPAMKRLSRKIPDDFWVKQGNCVFCPGGSKYGKKIEVTVRYYNYHATFLRLKI